MVLRSQTRPRLEAALARLSPTGVASGQTLGSGPVSLALTPGTAVPAAVEAARVALRSPGPAILLGAGFAVVEGAYSGDTCFLFPGQGSAHAGMLRDVAAAYPGAMSRLREMDAALVQRGHDPLSQVMWEEPDRLGEVLWAQLAVLGGGVLMAQVAAAHGLTPRLVSGHSYGDYPALVVAGALTLDQAVDLTLARCEAIVEAAFPERMAAVLAGREKVASLLAGLPGFAAESNVNGPAQVVVSGEDGAIDALLDRCREAGVEARLLPVPGAFHSRLMEPAAQLFAGRIQEIELAPPRIAFLSSVTGREMRSPEELRAALVAQFTAPVDFVAQVEGIHAAGVRRFVEVGPGSVLTGLVSAILGPRALAVSLDDRKRPGIVAVERALTALRAAESGEGAPLDLVPVAPPLFDEREWSELARDARWAGFWSATRPSLQAFVRDLFARLPAPAPDLAETPTQDTVRFFDATTRRQGSAAPAIPHADTPTAAAASVAAVTAVTAVTGQEESVRAALLEQVIALTGYPPDLVGFDLDMEADLGIDSVKQAQIFGRVRERFDLATEDRLSLRDFPTLGHVLRFVMAKLDGIQQTADLTPPAPPVLRLEGTPFEMGRQHGQEQGETIRRLVAAYESFLGPERLSRAVLQEALAHPEAFLDEDGIEEIRGLAEGSGVPERHLLAYNIDAALFTEYGPLQGAGPGCAHAGLGADRHRAPGVAGPLHAVNEDSALALYLGKDLSRVVQVRRPARGLPHVLFSFPGQVGGLNGANAGGLVATSCVLLDRTQTASASASSTGLVHGVLVRRMLQEATDTDAALAVARRLPRRGAWSVLLSHAREAALACFEYEGGGWAEKGGLTRHLGSNHARLSPGPEPPEHSRHRLERLEQLLGSDDRQVAVEELKRTLRDRFDPGRGRVVAHPTMSTVCRVDNVMGLVADVAAGRLSVTTGSGAESEEPRWLTLDLASLFGTSPVPAPPRVPRTP
jgi:acyl transferase domain-containing protein